MKKTFVALAALMLGCQTVQSQTLPSACYHGDVETGYAIGIGDYDLGYYTQPRKLNTEAISVKLGFDF